MNSPLFSGVHPLEEGLFFNLTREHTQDIKYIPEVIYLEENWKILPHCKMIG